MILVPLPWDRPPLSLNDRDHWAVKARKTKAARAETAIAAALARTPSLDAAAVTIVWRVPNNRERDNDNLVATLKPAIDGLRDAGVLASDSWRHVTRISARIDAPNGPAAMWLELEEATQ